MEVDGNEDKVPEVKKTEAKLEISSSVVNAYLDKNKQSQKTPSRMGSLKKKTTEKFKESKRGVKYVDNDENDFEQNDDSEGEEEEAMPKVEGNSKFGRLRKKSSRYSY